MLFLLIFFYAGGVLADNVIRYDTLTGRHLTIEEYNEKAKANLTFWCTGTYEPCDPNEGRRSDVTCNNLKHPNVGAAHTPSAHLLPPVFGKDNTPVKTKSGQNMPNSRRVRTSTLIDGTIPDQKFTAIVPHYMLFLTVTTASIHDSANYIRWTKTCCKPEGKNNPICSPITIPPDDPTHMFSGIRCQNLTKPLTYQNLGCTRNPAGTPVRINSASNFLDLSNIYTFTDEYRSYKDGLLQVSIGDDGIIWPLSTDYPQEYCFTNHFPKETRCSKFDQANGLFGQAFFSILIWRLHNFFAKKLKEVNPNWSDEKLFTVAKDLNIAATTHAYYYDLMPDLFGKNNLIRDGVILRGGTGFRDVYDENIEPKVFKEYLYALRWVHTIQPGFIKHFDTDGSYIKQVPVVNLTLRTGYFDIDNHMVGMTQGQFRQPMGKGDHVISHFLGQLGYNDIIFRMFDVAAADLEKGGLLGMQGYVKYRELCTGISYTKFDDLSWDMEDEYIEILKGLFEDVEDIPLMVGIWLEKNIPGGHVPRTAYCIISKQLRNIVRYDRHWYERPNRPKAFNAQQLAEISKASLAWIMCAVGDSVTEIQPKACLRERLGNRIASCKSLPQINFEAWRDKPRGLNS